LEQARHRQVGDDQLFGAFDVHSKDQDVLIGPGDDV
jgi:hypothetical protein